MSWGTASQKVADARNRLQASSPTFASLFPVVRCHAPKLNILADPTPAALFERTSSTYERHAPGESYGKGQVAVVLYFNAEAFSIDVVEDLADRIATEVCEWTGDGLFVTACSAGLCSDPSNAQRAAASDVSETTRAKSYRTIVLLLTWEG